MRFLFNPALLHFVVMLALGNLAVNVLHLLGFASLDALTRTSEVTAAGFVVAVLYTAIWERPAAN
jgi:hypothetical protein